MSNTLSQIKDKIRDFENLQDQLSEFGASDTEPDGVFQSIIYNASIGKTVRLPAGRVWQLYRKHGTRLAIAKINAICKEIVTLIMFAPNKERSKIRKYIKEYCWRVR